MLWLTMNPWSAQQGQVDVTVSWMEFTSKETGVSAKPHESFCLTNDALSSYNLCRRQLGLYPESIYFIKLLSHVSALLCVSETSQTSFSPIRLFLFFHFFSFSDIWFSFWRDAAALPQLDISIARNILWIKRVTFSAPLILPLFILQYSS